MLPQFSNINDKYGGPVPRHRRAQVDLLCPDDIPDEDEQALIPRTLYRKNLHLLVGPEASGKSMLMISMAAAISNENCDKWLDEPCLSHGMVVIVSDEDSLATLKNRLIAANANMRNIRFLGNYRKSSGSKDEQFSMRDHGEVLKLELDSLSNIIAVFFDNIGTSMGGFKRTSQGSREAFNYIKGIESLSDSAIIFVTHFNKGYKGVQPLSHVAGGAAITQVSRVILTTKKIEGKQAPNGSSMFALIREKLSIDKGQGTGDCYFIEEVSIFGDRRSTRICGAGSYDQSTDEPQGLGRIKMEQLSKKQIAMNFIRDQLLTGPMQSSDLLKSALDSGISERTLERARDELGIYPFKDKDGLWWVELPKPKHHEDDDPELH